MSKTVEVNRTDLGKLLDYLRDDEERNYEETEKGERKGHIYEVIKRLDKAL
jgi:hypothetical protein